MEAEAVDLAFESGCGGAEALDAGRGGGHLGEVFVAEGVDGMERGAGLVRGGGLLGGCDGDLGDHAVDAFGHLNNAFEGFTGLIGGDYTLLDGEVSGGHAGDGGAGSVLDSLDHGGDFACGLGGGFGKAADLSCDDGEAAALFSCAGGLDGGVEGEQVGLAGDLVDDGDDLGDAVGVISEQADGGGGVVDGGGDRAHGAEHLLDDGIALVGGLGGGACGLGGGLGVAGDFGDGGGHLLHGGGSLLGLLGLLVDAVVDLVGGGAHGEGSCSEGIGVVGDRADDAAEAALHLLHGAGERADLVGGVDVEFCAGKITGGDGVGAVGDQVDAARDAPGENKREEAAGERSEDGGGPQSEEDGEVELLQRGHFSVALPLLGQDEGPHGGEQGGIPGKNLSAQEFTGLA